MNDISIEPNLSATLPVIGQDVEDFLDTVNPDVHRHRLAKALRYAKASRCPKMQFGCVICDYQMNILGVGHNWSVREACYEKCPRAGIPSGTKLERCYAVHAEQSAVVEALESSSPCEPKIAYLSGVHPDGSRWKSHGHYCSFCARIMRAGGVVAVVVPTANSDGFSVLTIDEVIDSAFAVAFGEREA
jgi:deoxycytidylate deaminase